MLSLGRVPRCPLSLGPWTRWTRSRSTSETASSKNLYQELGLTSVASSEDIKKAYYEQSKTCHPDLFPGDPAALQKFQRISEAHSVLSQPQLRRNYDRGLLGHDTSVADKEAMSHTFEGEAFYDSRRERRRVNNNLDYFMKETRTGGFDHSQRYKQRSTSTTAEERRSKQARWERKQATGGGGGKLFLVALLVFVAFIKMRS